MSDIEEYDGCDRDGCDRDYFGNIISWRYTETDGLITFFFGKNEITTWYCEIEPIDCFNDFFKLWNTAQKSELQ